MGDETCELLCLDLPLAEHLRARRLSEEQAERSSSRARALGDPTRVAVAAALAQADGELCVCDLSWVVGRSQKLVSHHVRQLRAAGLVRSRRAGKMVMYALTGSGRALLDVVLAPEVMA